MDSTAIFKLSYGMFFLGCEYNGEKNICVVNTVSQVTQEPLRVSVTVLKGNFTNDLMLKAKKFSVGIISEKVSLDMIDHFGSQSGRDVDKLADVDCKVDKLNNPLFDSGCVASLCCSVTQTIDLGSHTMYIADIVDATNLDKEEPLTYNNYRAIKAGVKTIDSDNSNAVSKSVHQCVICHYIYDGETPFEDLPDDYICPICKKDKSFFQEV